MNLVKKPPVSLSLMLVVGIIAISFSAIFVKWSAAPAPVIAMNRLLITVLIMLPFIYKYLPEFRRISLRSYFSLFMSGLMLGLHFLFWMESLRWTSVASSTAILTLEPVLVMAGSFWVFRHKVSRTAIVAMAVAMFGAILIGWGDFRFSGDALKGDLLSFIGTIAVAVHMIIGKSLRAHMSAYVYSMCVFLIGAFVLGVYSVAVGYPLFDYSADEWGLFFLLAVVSTLFGHYVFNWLLKYMSATTVSMAVLGEPLGATILAFFLLGESITPVQFAAGLLLLVGVAVFIRSQEKEDITDHVPIAKKAT
ncbi:DMT family transporter [Paenibacillus sp. N1-5-1-14]|uniref:DMT family transporter n=1 Tax=Paenibacillus radicibacter TaxID=2972488 RepID=UPI0021591EB1|nr:DMT family transporter [Paenibacillus radicibacter]MCR8641331.1 DMT family transporter [Paenibacillus radicibacter]